MLLIIELIFSLFLGCHNSNDKHIYIREHFKSIGDSLKYQDSLILQKKDGNVYQATILRDGIEKQFVIEQNINNVKGFNNHTSFIIYTTLDKEIHENIYHNDSVWDMDSPYLVEDSKYLETRKFNIKNKIYQVHSFKTDNFHVDAGGLIAYYSPEFGFILYAHYGGSYEKLIKITDVPSTQNEIINNLTKEVIRDTTFFYRPSYLRTTIIFSEPKIKNHKLVF
jgi:hypothetical protein